jgi:hypothetical protein
MIGSTFEGEVGVGDVGDEVVVAVPLQPEATTMKTIKKHTRILAM